MVVNFGSIWQIGSSSKGRIKNEFGLLITLSIFIIIDMGGKAFRREEEGAIFVSEAVVFFMFWMKQSCDDVVTNTTTMPTAAEIDSFVNGFDRFACYPFVFLVCDRDVMFLQLGVNSDGPVQRLF